jgi:hypothetical protein
LLQEYDGKSFTHFLGGATFNGAVTFQFGAQIANPLPEPPVPIFTMPPIPMALPAPVMEHPYPGGILSTIHGAPTFEIPPSKRRNISYPILNEEADVEIVVVVDAGADEDEDAAEESHSEEDENNDDSADGPLELTFSQRCVGLGKRVSKQRIPGT